MLVLLDGDYSGCPWAEKRVLYFYSGGHSRAAKVPASSDLRPSTAPHPAPLLSASLHSTPLPPPFLTPCTFHRNRNRTANYFLVRGAGCALLSVAGRPGSWQSLISHSRAATAKSASFGRFWSLIIPECACPACCYSFKQAFCGPVRRESLTRAMESPTHAVPFRTRCATVPASGRVIFGASL